MLVLLSLCVILSSQVDANLLDPTLIGRELQKFAKDALGVDEMQVAKRLKKAVEESYARSAKAAPQTECCKVDKSTLKYDERFRSKVDLNNICLKISGSASSNPVHLDDGVFKEMKGILKNYFGSEQGVMTNFPVFDDKEKCDKYDPRYRPFYVETATPEAKDVVLVIDISASMTGEKLYIAKEAAKNSVGHLEPKRPGWYRVIQHSRLNSRKCWRTKTVLTRYRLAFEKAFSLLKGSNSGELGNKKKRLILFLTDGAPTDPEIPIFETIKNRNFELNNSVIILTFGFGSADQAILQDIAKQDTTKHGVPANTSVGDITKGSHTFVEDIKTLRIKLATYYNLFALGTQLSPVVSVPYIDAFGTGQSTYAFMISNSGRTLIHPLLPEPTDAYGDPIFMDIRTLEPETGFNEVFDSIINGKSGSKRFVAKRFLPRGGKEKEGVTVTEMNSTYFWIPLVEIDFSLGVVVPVSHAKDQLNSLQIPDDTTMVKFAPGAFKDPYKYIGKHETKADVDLLTAYMKDDTGTVTNPGLKNDIRDTVIATWKVEDLWLRDKTDLAQYVVWRYIGTSNGVFRITPGTVEKKRYDPRQRPWYYTALANTGMLALTTPYLDFGGAGVVITAGRALLPR
ncbi:hypothetical protein OS493_031702 [Desmophyllum pertusum]|uniref:VWFA domain-containing protein n=1 Tax=Desmophyllum pertusum TaxID=174260 RepID=A0A9W9ZJN5_9CNID|nr:hypothetical protein OS493_031702 [Desmophyllum pertusum]